MKYYLTSLITILVIYLCIIDVSAQQTQSFSEYNFNPFIINSAYAGFENATEITVSSNSALTQFEGSPRNLALTINSPLNSNQIGVGGGIIRDQIGVTSITSIYGAYAYKIPFDLKKDRPAYEIFNENVISFGITAGVQFYNDNLLELGIDDDENFNENIRSTIPIVGAGFLWNTAQFYAGLSSPNLIGSITANNQIQLKNTYYAYAGYRFFTTPFNKVQIKPSVLTKYEDGAPLQVDINTTLNYNNKIEFGIGYRTTSSANVFVGLYAFNKLRFVYNYTQTFGNSVLTNTHGLMLSYHMNKGYKFDN